VLPVVVLVEVAILVVLEQDVLVGRGDRDLQFLAQLFALLVVAIDGGEGAEAFYLNK
jgi:hypothetical protein